MGRMRSSTLSMFVVVILVMCVTLQVPSWTFAAQGNIVAPRSLTGYKVPFDHQRGFGKVSDPRSTTSFMRAEASAEGAAEASAEGAAEAAAAAAAAAAPGEAKKGSRIDVVLMAYFFFWYLGNYYYNITNKRALVAAGGAAGYPLTIATLQLAVGGMWGLMLWGYPSTRKLPQITFDDFKKNLPVGFCSAGAHMASVFALSAGAVSFGQIVKAAEPAFAALLGTMFYKANISKAKWLCLIPVIGGVVFASLGELSFTWAALFTAGLANVFAAFKANENKKLMTTPGLKDRIGGVGNQFALSILNAFLFCAVLAVALEGYKFGSFIQLVKTSPVLLANIIFSGIWFYAYNELATMTIKKTNAVTQSVANTAKRVIVIVGVAIVLRESLDPLKLFGCFIGIGGVFLYSIIDDLVGKK